ncbi:uncharacterized protein [Miscanthus floridulus]|uniref:uncharacterized protein n=1 Tax=Miscanthus floridulus TaxID=154761 RepID=UPI003458CF54
MSSQHVFSVFSQGVVHAPNESTPTLPLTTSVSELLKSAEQESVEVVDKVVQNLINPEVGMAFDSEDKAYEMPPSRPRRPPRLFVDDSTGRVVLAEAGEDAVAFILSVLADPRAAVDELLRGRLLRQSLCLRGPPAAGRLRRFLEARGQGQGQGHHGVAPLPLRPPRVPLQRRRVAGARLRVPLRCAPCCAATRRRRDTEVHFLEASFYRRPDGSAVTTGRGAGRSGDTFYRCKARDDVRGRDFLPCRYRVTDKRGVRCLLCHGLTSVEVKCAKADGGGEAAGSACRYAILDDLTVKPVVSAGGLSVAVLLSAVGVTADAATVREVNVPFAYKEGLGMIWASLHSKTVLTNVFRSAVVAGAGRRR